MIKKNITIEEAFDKACKENDLFYKPNNNNKPDNKEINFELEKDCRNCSNFKSCMDLFGFIIDANKCSQFKFINVD